MTGIDEFRGHASNTILVHSTCDMLQCLTEHLHLPVSDEIYKHSVRFVVSCLHHKE